MLTIHYGDIDGVIYNTSIYFNNTYSKDWLADPFAQRIIKSVDKGIVLGPNTIETKALGIIPPEKLSTGAKVLLLMYFTDGHIFLWKAHSRMCRPFVPRSFSRVFRSRRGRARRRRAGRRTPPT